ncbi:MAG: hypothetical protein E7594_02980 [Ruminococcaceae bacterium]|nr:hypothetical protein [Oscillospiraceae bacterium]
MKKLLALVLSMLLVASCFAMMVYAEEETTAASEETTVAAEGEETTEGEAPSYSNTLLVFNENAKDMKILTSPNGINKTYYKSEWEGARLKITKPDDPYVQITWSQYIRKADLEQLDSQSYPFVVFKLKVVGYIDDIELFYCAGEISGPTGGYSSTTDYPGMYDGSVEYIIYDLTGDCEGNYNVFRFDPMGADEDTEIYVYEMAFFATEDEAIKYAGLDQVTEAPTTEPAETEPATEKETEAPTTEAVSRPERGDKAEDKGCGGIVSVGAVVAVIALGVVCIKKKD